MAGFYRQLADVYDHIFPLDDGILRFLADRSVADRTVLDVACGTGTYAAALAAGGRRVVGVDLDDAMVAKARSKYPGLDFRVADMLSLPTDLCAAPTLVYCIGNSIVHLAGPGQIAKAMAGFRDAAAPGGRIVVQIVNYDRLLLDGVRELPVLSGPGFEFRRRYEDRPDGRFEFQVEVRLGEEYGEREVRAATPLLPVRASELAALAASVGIRSHRLYGNFDGSDYVAGESFLTILEGVA